jgi:uncharacterized protein involved in exopolysaccharide biosynthesis
MEDMKAGRQIDEDSEAYIDLRDLFLALWSKKKIILLITTLSAAFSVHYALSIPNEYKAEALVVPSDQQSTSLGGLGGQLGGIASLAGVSIGGGSDKSLVAQKVMQSRSFIEHFIRDNDLAPEVYAVEGWDQRRNKLIINSDIYDPKLKVWKLKSSDNEEVGPPSGWQLYNAFIARLKVVEDGTSGFVNLSIQHYSPSLAKKWLDLYIVAINKHMQQREVIRVARNIKYLEEQIQKTSISQMQEVFYTIVQDQIKDKMLAEASPDYVFSAVSPSMLPSQKSTPNRALICVFGTMIGGFLSIFFVLAFHYGKKVGSGYEVTS